MKCDQDADTIREFCRLLREKAILDIQNKWKYLSHRLLPHALNVFLKFAKINSILDKINKRKFMEKFSDSAFFRYLTDLLVSLLTKHDDNAKKYLLKRRFNDWVEQTRRLREYENSMASKIQNAYRNYIENKRKLDDMQLKMLLQRFIGKILNKSDLSLPSAFYRWSKNTRLLRCNENSTLIQDFCQNIKEVLKNMAWEKKLKKIGEGLDILDGTSLGLRYAYDKLKENNRNLALAGVANLLQEKVNDRRRQVLDKINEWIKDFLLNKLFPFRQNYLDNLLRKKLHQWKDTATELTKRLELEEEKNNRIIELLKIMVDRYDDDKMAV